MALQRQDPDKLTSITREEQPQHKGRLKLFFGYAAGVGKTYAMLKDAHAAKQSGIDVVAGYIEPHAKPQTSALISGLEQLACLNILHNGILLREFDLDAALRRKPQLILVDELAHTNACGCRHAKRYQDVEELLNAGIDVYSTVNVQHIESLNDIVTSITGVTVRDRIPDSVFDNVNQVKLIDIEPQELLERLSGCNIYQGGQAERAAQNFFTAENLTALRGLALRRCADRMNLLTESTRVQVNGDYRTDEHILVCLSSAPSNAKIIRTAARMAAAFKGTFTALFVETPNLSAMSDENKKRLQANTRLAQQLGAQIETVFGDDVPLQIAEFARLSGVSKVVIGRSTATRRGFLAKPTLTERLIANAPNLDVHIIPDSETGAAYREQKIKRSKSRISLGDIAKTIGVLFLATTAGLVFYRLGFTEANIITVYILGVLIISAITTNRIYSLVASVVSVMVFNFFFTPPRFTFQAYDSGYPVTFAVMFIAAFITGSLAAKLKEHAKKSAQAAHRTKILFDTNQLLQQAKDSEAILSATAEQLVKLLGKNVIAYPMDGVELGKPRMFFVEKDSCDEGCMTENEKTVAAWVSRNNKHAGATTDTLSGAKCLYLAIRVNQNVYGVVGIEISVQPLDMFENSVVLSILGECALALENEKNAREKEEAAVAAKNEQLRANLLRAISHDLRTPLTSISGNASNLLSNGDCFDEDTKKHIYMDIYDDSMWLINLVENLLSVSRIEEGRMNLSLTSELVDEVIAEALCHVNRKSVQHTIITKYAEEFILAKMDAKLIVQVFINIVDNAIKYTPAGSAITIFTEKKNNQVLISIADDGPGIPNDAKKRVFDMFYSGNNRVADSRRSLGLGLSLCKSIIQAHGGAISVSDNAPQGTVFTFTLPIGEVTLHE